MRKIWLILPIVAALGVGCLTQTPGLPVEPTEPVVQVQEVFGVLDGWDEASGVARVRTSGGGVEEVRWPSGASSPSDRMGSLVRASGVRDGATLQIVGETVSFEERGAIVVVSPVAGATVTSPLQVQGFGRVFEQTLDWRVKDVTGSVVAQGYAMTDARDIGQYGPFQFEIFLPALADQSFVLEVLTYSAQDGSEQDVVTVPLRLLSTATSTFDVYFSHAQKGSNEDCTRTFAVSRTVAQTSAVGRAAILELLEGPTLEEAAQGYATNIPAQAGLRSLVISGETAKADFDSGLSAVAGSCRVTAIRSQIEKTLDQFPSVHEVVISVNGEVETALQP